ncbi:MAG: sugar transferase [Flavobacteriales bacterium]|nr:sugar transferase [Flavobacteriales bacterium]
MKRAFDIVVSAISLVLLAPVLLAIGAWVSWGSPGGAFFRQIRVGRGGRPFLLLKFRTMRANTEQQGQLTAGEGDPRVTAQGRVLRRTKLDELPQLLNVLRGDMSLVGPRPEVPRYVELYTPEQQQVLSVRPGMTGAASLEFIDEQKLLGAVTDPERTYVEEIMPGKLELELRYIREQSLFGDLCILIRTVGRLI